MRIEIKHIDDNRDDTTAIWNGTITIRIINNNKNYFIDFFNNCRDFQILNYWSLRETKNKKICEEEKVKKIINLFRIGILKEGMVI